MNKYFYLIFSHDILYLANNYCSNCRPSLNTVSKHNILEKFGRNKDVVIIRMEKGNGVVGMDRVICNQQVYAHLRDKNKFKKLTEYPTKLLEGRL